MTDRRYYYSRPKIAFLLALSILVAGGVVAFLLYALTLPGMGGAGIALAVILFLCLSMVLVTRSFLRLYGDRRAIVTLTDEGLIDRRVSDDLVKWSAVRAVEDYRGRGGRMFFLRLRPCELAKLKLTRSASFYSPYFDAVQISQRGLDVSANALLREIRARATCCEP